MLLSIILSVPVVLLFCAILYKCLLAFGAPIRTSGKFIMPEDGPRSTDKPTGQWKIFLFALSIRLLVLIAAVFCVMLSAKGEISLEDCLGKLNLWDAKHYINLVDQGYMDYQEKGKHLFLVFYPGYVWLVRLVRLIIPHTALAGVAVSTLCFSWGCCWVHKIAFKLYDKTAADDALLFLSIFPFSFFFGSVMTEGLFLLTTAASCYYALNRKWLRFALWGILAALTRMTGIIVIVPAIIEFLKAEKPLSPQIKSSMGKTVKKFLVRLPLLFAPCLGMVGYWLLNYRVDGDPFAYMTHQEHWFQGPMWISETFKYFFYYLGLEIQESSGWAIWIPELLLFVLFFAVIVLSLKSPKSPSSVLAYAFSYLIANYSLSWLLSAGRYLSCGFVFFILLAVLVKNKPSCRSYIIVIESMFLGIFLFGHLIGAQIM